MRRIRLVIAYDGSRYSGWQIQENSITIEQILKDTLEKILKENIEIIGASRTDAGVHAMGNVAVFDTQSQIPADKFSYMLNQWLPKDIRIRKSDEVNLEWHPRAEKCTKTYEYKILNARHEIPIGRDYAHFVYLKLDIEKMKEAAQRLLGEHDFASFASRGGSAKTTIRTIYSLDIIESPVDELNPEERMIKIRISGSGFLYNMVRIIAGTLLQVGTGLKKPEDMDNILAAANRDFAGPTAPARGLTLVKLDYLEGNEEI